MEEEDYWIDLNLSSNDKYDSVINDDLQLFFQEVAIAVQTAPGEIWGQKTAIDLKQYLSDNKSNSSCFASSSKNSFETSIIILSNYILKKRHIILIYFQYFIMQFLQYAVVYK